MPWWEQELPAIRHEQSIYLSRHLLAFRADHDDLINEALWALTDRIRRRRSVFPDSWFRCERPEKDDERSYLHKLAMIILRRRIADFFRKCAPAQIMFTVDECLEDLADPDAPSPERRIMLAKILEITRSVLEKAKAEDRDLIALICADTGLRNQLNGRERKRLQRLREKLRVEIARRLGDDVTELLQLTL
jgi:hypothetical protein